MDKSTVNYSLYLVTDSTPAILGDKDICEVVEVSLKGGVSVVQYRDKTSDTRDLIETAKRLHSITRKYNVPLLINDRVDVALAVGCEGVHLGQDDMDISPARQILGPNKIIGVTISNEKEALAAFENGADYFGIGTVYATSTKKNTKEIIGPSGVRHLLDYLYRIGCRRTPSVCIGGINARNTAHVMREASLGSQPLSGVAVVSAIMAAGDPEAGARRLAELISTAKPTGGRRTLAQLPVLHDVAKIIKRVNDTKPLSHNMTNLVVQNFAANVALAVGASPIMANYGEEAMDLARLGGALVINMGTVTPEGLENYTKALKAYNAGERPVVFDPVGAGATSVRRQAVKTILGAGYMAVIKGNESEIKTVWGQEADETAPQRGVDSSSTLRPQQKASLVQQLAKKTGSVILMTGVKDYVSDGTRTYSIAHGDKFLGEITGSGCVLGTTISATISVWPEDHLAAVIAAVLWYELAAEDASRSPTVHGPGTFVPAFIDALAALRRLTAEDPSSWRSRSLQVEEWPVSDEDV